VAESPKKMPCEPDNLVLIGRGVHRIDKHPDQDKLILDSTFTASLGESSLRVAT
jgi:hypothetical protein